MKKCSSARKYKATRPPKCNHGRGCDECNRKWTEKHKESNMRNLLNTDTIKVLEPKAQPRLWEGRGVHVS